MNENSLSKSEQDENKEFDSIAKALSDGDTESLDRLMAAEQDDEQKAPAGDDDKLPLDKPEESGDDKEEEEKPEETPEEEDETEDELDKLLKDEKPPVSEKTSKKKEEAAPSAASTATDKDLEQELHRLRSDAGRVPFLQRRLADLERELRAQKARTPSAAVDSKTTGKPADLSTIELDEETQKELDELKEVDPVLARTLERMHKKAIAAANSRADHVVDTFTQSEQEAEDQRFYLEQKAQLTQMIPKHETIFALPEWAQWKDTLTPGQRALAESGYANEVAQAIYAFAADMQRRTATQAADTQDKSATPPAKTEVSQARQRKVQGDTDVKSSAAKKDEAFDEDKYFSEMYEMERKNSHIT